MKNMIQVCAVAVAVVSLGLAVGCKREEGPLEKAGRHIDDAAKKTGEAVKDGAEKTEEAAKEAAEKAKEAGK